MGSDGRTLTLSSMRVAIGRRMSDSKASIPHFYVSTDMEMDGVLEAVERVNAGRERKDRVTVTAFILRALAATLREHPHFNAVWQGGTPNVVDAINISVAVSVEGGLLAPAILGASSSASRSCPSVSAKPRLALAPAGSAPLRPRRGPSHSTNLGGFDVSAFAAIITPPQVAILAISRITQRPVVREGAIVIRNVMTATLSADHRVVDGAAAGKFLQDLHALLKTPTASADAQDPV